MSGRCQAIASLSIALLAASVARGSVLRPLDISELALEATIVVQGRVVDVRPEWVRGGRQIDSLVTIVVEASFKGEPARTLSFVSPGGQIGYYRSVVAGAPEFAEGAEVVLFLGPSGPRGYPGVVGLAQGVLPVSLDGTGKKRVRVPLLVPGLAEAHLPVRISVTLPELAEQLARILAAGRANSRPGVPR